MERVLKLSLARPVMAAALSVLAIADAAAQHSRAAERRARADSLAAVVQRLEERIAMADSLRDPVAASTARLELAAQLPPKPALRLVEAATATLDTIHDPEAALKAHRELALRYAELKMHDKAHAEWATIVSLTERMRDDALATVRTQQAENTALAGKVDELTGSLNKAVAAIAKSNEEHARQQEFARWMILGGSALLLLSVVFFTWFGIRQRRELRTLRKEVDRVRAELVKAATSATADAAPLHTRTRDAVVIPGVEADGVKTMTAPQAPAEQVAERAAPATEEDAVLLAMVRRRGHERLITLREARARGDHDKVMRVVHTMKPQLVSIDAAYFQELCGRLVGTDPGTDPARWMADLDRFEEGMVRVLGQGA